MQTFSREHRELLVRQTQTTPLVVCVLDRFLPPDPPLLHNPPPLGWSLEPERTVDALS